MALEAMLMRRGERDEMHLDSSPTKEMDEMVGADTAAAATVDADADADDDDDEIDAVGKREEGCCSNQPFHSGHLSSRALQRPRAAVQ